MAEAESPRGNGLLLFLVAVLGFLGIRASGPAPTAPEHAAAAKAEDAAARKETGDAPRPAEAAAGRAVAFWQPVSEFRGRTRPATPAGDRDGPAVVPAVARTGPGAVGNSADPDDGAPDVKGWESRFLIVCVPDPNDSSSGDRFDRLIDAVQRAAEMQGYVLDRYYYPWPIRRAGRKQADVGADGGPATARRAARSGAVAAAPSAAPGASPEYDPERQPGMLLLRDPRPHRSDTGPRLLQVLLVSETATAGLNKEAFDCSLRYVGSSDHCKRHKEVSILGPFFSGSQVSLERALRPWLGGAAHFRVISGAATGIVTERLVKDLTEGADGTVSFRATVLPDAAVFEALLAYLNLGYRKVEADGKAAYEYTDNFAVLYESNTAFGQRSVRPRSPDKREPGPGPVLFPFPLHVSEVRAEYDRSGGAGPENSLRLPAFGARLRLPAKRTGDLRESEPSLAPTATAAMDERTLDAMLNVIAHERLRYVFILASDVKDKLFLAGLLRRYCPECRLVFSSADLLFGHPDFTADLRGSIVGSSYPLFPANQHWSYPFGGKRARFVFTVPSEYGYYNATTALLNPADGDALLEYGPPFPGLCPEDADRQTPPVWISVIGQGGLYPVTAVAQPRDDPYGGYVFRPDAPPAEEGAAARPAAEMVPAHPTLWTAMVLGLAVLLGSLLAAHGRAAFGKGVTPGPGDAGDDRGLFELFRPRAGRQRRRQRFYVFACLAASLVAFAYVVYVWLIPPANLVGSWFAGRDSPVRIGRWHWVAPALLTLLLAAALALPAAVWWRGRRGAKDPGWPDEAPAPDEPDPPPERGAAKAPAASWSWPGPRTLARYFGEHRVFVLCVVLLGLLVTYLAVNYARPLRPAAARPLLFLTRVESLLFFERATSLADGVSPVMPVVLLGVAFFLWGLAQLRRLAIRDRWRGTNPFPGPGAVPGDPTLGRLDQCRTEIYDDLATPRRAFSVPWALPVWLAVAFAFCRIAGRFTPSVEGMVTEGVLLAALATLAMLIVAGWMYLRKLWGDARELLLAVADLPLQGAFGRLPGGLTRVLGPYLSLARDGRRQLRAYRADRCELLASEYGRIAVDLKREAALPDDVMAELDGAMNDPGAAGANTPWEVLSLRARACLRALLCVRRDPALAGRLFGGGPAAPAPGDRTAPVAAWLTRAEDFVALEATVYLSQFTAQLRNLALFLSVAPLLLLLAASSYPFQPQRSWLLLAGCLIGLMTFTVVRIIAQAERDELMSRIQKTTPGQLSLHWGFLSHVALYAMPLLGVLVTVSGGASDLVHTLFDPVLQLLK